MFVIVWLCGFFWSDGNIVKLIFLLKLYLIFGRRLGIKLYYIEDFFYCVIMYFGIDFKFLDELGSFRYKVVDW